MNLTSAISSSSLQWEAVQAVQEPKKRIQVQIISEPCSPGGIVSNLASMKGPVDAYSWYMGTHGLLENGAIYMKERIFEPLYQLKQDVKHYLCNLNEWAFTRNVSSMPSTTPMGETINRIDKAAIECIYSSSFFKFCTEIRKESGLYEFLNEELPKKKWLLGLSETQGIRGKTIAELFEGRTSLCDSIKDLDVSRGYSLMQYVEGYYLIQESVKKGLLNGQKKIQIVFLLPKGEINYYLDYPKEIERMLQADFGQELSDVEIYISFQFFEYGNALNPTPYIDKRPNVKKVKVKEIKAYFDYLTKNRPQAPKVESKERITYSASPAEKRPKAPKVERKEAGAFNSLSPSVSKQQPTMPFCRVDIHDLNGWNCLKGGN